MRWWLLALAACGSDFTETYYVHRNDAVAVTIGEKTFSDDLLEIDRTFPTEDEAESAAIPVTIHFADADVNTWLTTRCTSEGFTFDTRTFVEATCSFYMTNHMDDPDTDGGEGLNFTCGCTDSDGNSDGYSSSNPPRGFGF